MKPSEANELKSIFDIKEVNVTTTEQTFTEELYSIKPVLTVVVTTTPWHELKLEETEQLQKISDALRQRIQVLRYHLMLSV